MNDWNELLPLLAQVPAWIEHGGIGLIALLVFVETGLLIGLIVPGGETLLFSAGLLTGVGTLRWPVVGLIVLLVAAAVAGDVTGFFLGRRIGGRLQHRPDSWWFKRRYVERSERFYQQHPRRALLVGRFLPIIRTFNPLLAGSSGLSGSRFLLLTGLGSLAYVTALVLAGYFLGQAFPKLGDYVQYLFLGVVVAVLGTLAWKAYQSRHEPAGT
jgi:membrane-associated protein